MAGNFCCYFGTDRVVSVCVLAKLQDQHTLRKVSHLLECSNTNAQLLSHLHAELVRQPARIGHHWPRHRFTTVSHASPHSIRAGEKHPWLASEAHLACAWGIWASTAGAPY